MRVNFMTGRINNLIYQQDIQTKIVVSDLDGTLLWGDLGETVFFLIITLQGKNLNLQDGSSFLAELKQTDEVYCPENRQMSWPRLTG
jgi:phosphatidate phosphatase PAH1